MTRTVTFTRNSADQAAITVTVNQYGVCYATTEADDSMVRDVCSRINRVENGLDDVREILEEDGGWVE